MTFQMSEVGPASTGWSTRWSRVLSLSSAVFAGEQVWTHEDIHRGLREIEDLLRERLAYVDARPEFAAEDLDHLLAQAVEFEVGIYWLEQDGWLSRYIDRDVIRGLIQSLKELLIRKRITAVPVKMARGRPDEPLVPLTASETPMSDLGVSLIVSAIEVMTDGLKQFDQIQPGDLGHLLSRVSVTEAQLWSRVRAGEMTSEQRARCHLALIGYQEILREMRVVDG